jgi:hypothetical protein
LLPEGRVEDPSIWPVQCFWECPTFGTLEIVSDPAVVVDRCTVAGIFRKESRSDTIYSDIDLDGSPERIEIGFRGNASAPMYVFREIDGGYEYLGQFSAHPSFTVRRDSSGVPTIQYIHRFGVDDLWLRRIQYIGNEFVTVSTQQVSADSTPDAESISDE